MSSQHFVRQQVIKHTTFILLSQFYCFDPGVYGAIRSFLEKKNILNVVILLNLVLKPLVHGLLMNTMYTQHTDSLDRSACLSYNISQYAIVCKMMVPSLAFLSLEPEVHILVCFFFTMTPYFIILAIAWHKPTALVFLAPRY